MPTARAIFFLPFLCQLATAARPARHEELLEGRISATGKIIKGQRGAKSIGNASTSNSEAKSIGNASTSNSEVDGVCCLCSLKASFQGDGTIYTPEVRDRTYGNRGAPKTVIRDGQLSVWHGWMTLPLFCLVDVEAKYQLGPLGNWGRKCSEWCPQEGDVKYRYVMGYHADDDKKEHHVKGACAGSRDSRLFYKHAVEEYDIDATLDKAGGVSKTASTVGVGQVLDSSKAFMRRYGLQNHPYRLAWCSDVEELLAGYHLKPH